MRVVLDRAMCTGIGICESLAPEIFEIDDNGDLLVLREDVTDEDIESVGAAVLQCPTEALRLLRG